MLRAIFGARPDGFRRKFPLSRRHTGPYCSRSAFARQAIATRFPSSPTEGSCVETHNWPKPTHYLRTRQNGRVNRCIHGLRFTGYESHLVYGIWSDGPRNLFVLSTKLPWTLCNFVLVNT